MRTLKESILKSVKGGKSAFMLLPKNRRELEEMIEKEINENGNNCSLNHIDVSKIDNLSGLFTFFKDFNGDISKWDVSKATRMDFMFYGTKFNGDISKWDVKNVNNMSMMFSGSKFDNDISEWDVSNVVNAGGMFSNCNFNHDISNWKTDKLENMAQMFYGNKKFNQPIGNWDVSKVEFINQLFYKAKSFNQDISEWKISEYAIKKVSNLKDVFFGCPIKQEYKPKSIQRYE